MYKNLAVNGSGALRRIEEIKRRVADVRERFDHNGRITTRMQALSRFTSDIMHTIATSPMGQDRTMLPGRRYSLPEPTTTKLGTPVTDESTNERYNMQMRAVLKRDLEYFANSFDLDVSDVIKSGAQLYTTGYLPVLGTIPAGNVKEAIQTTKYYEVVPPYLKPRPDLGDYLLEVSGDSMSPKIDTGSLVMLRPDIEAANGEICAVQIFRKGENDRPQSTLKRVFKDYKNKVWTLKPINPDYPDQEFSWEEYELEVVGVYRGQMAKG